MYAFLQGIQPEIQFLGLRVLYSKAADSFLKELFQCTLLPAGYESTSCSTACQNLVWSYFSREGVLVITDHTQYPRISDKTLHDTICYTMCVMLLLLL